MHLNTHLYYNCTAILDVINLFNKAYINIAFLFCPGGATYTPLYNLLNYPAGSVPITTVSKADLDEMKKYPTETYFQKGIKQVSEIKISKKL